MKSKTRRLQPIFRKTLNYAPFKVPNPNLVNGPNKITAREDNIFISFPYLKLFMELLLNFHLQS